MDTIAMKIKQFRTKNGVQQKVLAAAAGLSQSQLSKIEANKAKPHAIVLKKISHYLKVPVEHFYSNRLKTNSGSRQYTLSKNDDSNSLLSQIDALQKMLKHQDDLIAEQKNIIAQLNAKIARRNAKIEKIKKTLERIG